ncbi:carbonic anhydrase [Protaetiibacter mangrovi]|uniref:carbonic anhydrase n=1 Tax=Protaetiibacter mangrovi TaxID=2970926 RepID=A0ABT1ZE08_9MICO|nr:carbonic anhydrase [Protaetiibacter mangrovi]MCS0498943.1 carbonic anhydrase [Protaetiibacter mangrovi]TPX02423.1 carbonic anhydrase [Schumannella luteola]
MTETARRTPADVWREMVRGNERFVAGQPAHPRQDVERREELAAAQAPHAALFGCSDSRLAAEIIFDKGLGDLFVVRNAGQVISDSAIASLEYAVAVLDVPLIVVLAHDACGAVQAAIDLDKPDARPLPPHIAGHIAAIRPSVRAAASRDPEAVGLTHLERTVSELVARSELIADGVAAGTLAVVGANYKLLEGTAVPAVIVGDAA